MWFPSYLWININRYGNIPWNTNKIINILHHLPVSSKQTYKQNNKLYSKQFIWAYICIIHYKLHYNAVWIDQSIHMWCEAVTTEVCVVLCVQDRCVPQQSPPRCSLTASSSGAPYNWFITTAACAAGTDRTGCSRPQGNPISGVITQALRSSLQ